MQVQKIQNSYTTFGSKLNTIGKQLDEKTMLTEIFTTKNGDKYLKVDIFDKPYRFKLNEETNDTNKLNSMIENIEKTVTGFFIRNKRHEYFAPHILKKAPSICTKQIKVIKHGNCATEINEESVNALNVIEAQAKEKFDINELKTIKYLKNTESGYANNTVEKAFSYLDKTNNDLYLYIPKDNKVQVLIDENFVKNIKLDA